MKHGRLIIAALVGAMLITSLAGCGSKGTNDGESGEYQKINLSMAVNGTDTQIDSLERVTLPTLCLSARAGTS